MKKILINGISARVGGGVAFLLNLVPRLCLLAPEDRFILLAPEGEPWLTQLPSLPNLEPRPVPLCRPSFIGRYLFEQREIPALVRREGIDLLASIADVTSLAAPCKKMLWIRNLLIHTRRDVGWPWPWMLRIRLLRRMSEKSMRLADRVVFVSEASRDEIVPYNQISPENVQVIHHGIGENFRNLARSPLSERPATILSVSSIYRYKNFLPLIEAFSRWAPRQAEPWTLRIVGRNLDAPYFKRMEAARLASPVRERILFEQEIPYRLIQDVYQSARIFVFPSILETFGHPLLEALASGLSVVAADTPTSREILGDCGRYFKADDAEALQGVLDQARENPLVCPGDFFDQKGFTWDHSARKTLAVMRELMGEG